MLGYRAAVPLELYDVRDGSWLPRPIPEDCGWLCGPVAVGSQWIELATLRYPAMVDGSSGQVEPGDLVMLGQLALTTDLDGGIDLLQRCHSTWRKWLYGQALGGSRMVLWSDGLWVSERTPNHGLLLPSLRRFNFSIPPRIRPGEPNLAISGRTIYVLTYRGVLWAARVPRIG